MFKDVKLLIPVEYEITVDGIKKAKSNIWLFLYIAMFS